MDDRSGSVWAVAIVFAILTWLTVGLRIYVRAEQIGRFGLDDKLVILGQMMFTGYLICQMGGAVYGTGRHLADLDYGNAEIALKFWFFCEVWYAVATTTVKIAICTSLLRVTAKRTHVIIIYGLIIWSAALGLAFLLGVIFQCTPTSDWWSLDPSHKHCLSAHVITSLTYTVSALNVACDWTLGIFPFFIVKDLAIPMYQKMMVASILAFGAVASTATIVRMFYVTTLEQSYYGWDGDFLYDTTPVAVWTTVEVGVGITAICLSTLRPLIHKFLCFVAPSTYASSRSPYVRRRFDDQGGLSLTDPGARGDGTLSADGTLQSPSPTYSGITQFNRTKPIDEFAGVTQFNQTRPIESGYGRPSSKKTHKHKITSSDDLSGMVHFNATKSLTQTSYEDPDDDYYEPNPAYKRHHPT